MTSPTSRRASEWRSRAIGATATVLGRVVPRRPPPAPGSVRRLVVVKPASLGDVILASPAVATLRAAFPGAKLSLATGRWSLPAARGIPGIDEVIDLGTFGTPGRFGPRDLPAAVRTLKGGDHDLAIVLDRSPLVAAAPWLAGIPHRAGIDSDGRGFAHGVRVAWTRRRHEADLYLDVARAVAGQSGIPAGAVPRLAFEPGAEATAEADVMWRGSGLDRDAGRVVVIHPGGGVNPGMSLDAKRWPADRFAAVARHLAALGMRIAIVGHASDAAATTATLAGLTDVPVVDLTGRAGFGALAALIGRADGYLGNDSVPLHLAVAMGTPAVGLYGPTDPRVYGPYAPPGGTYATRGIGIVAPGACSQVRPFRPGPIDACPGCRCIDAITPSDVVDAVRRVVAEGRAAVA